MSKFGKWFKQKREKLQQWKKDNPKTAKALGRFGESMSASSQAMASSGGDGTVYKGRIVEPLVNENDLRMQDTTEDLLATKVGDDLAYAPYDEWIESKNKKDIIT